jgi:hypothetical protein
LGCWFYIAAPLIGSGVHLDPMPMMGILVSAIALLAAFSGYHLVRSQKGERVLAVIINIPLVIGAVSLAYGVAQWGFETVYRVQSSEWGHSRPGEVLFRVAYGGLSIVGLAVFNYRVRNANSTQR